MLLLVPLKSCHHDKTLTFDPNPHYVLCKLLFGHLSWKASYLTVSSLLIIIVAPARFLLQSPVFMRINGPYYAHFY